MKRTTIKDTKDRARNKSLMVEIKTAVKQGKTGRGKIKGKERGNGGGRLASTVELWKIDEDIVYVGRARESDESIRGARGNG